MGTLRVADTPLDQLLARRAKDRLDRVMSQVEQALAALAARGVVVQVVGSLARGEFRLNSDVDFLILDRGSLAAGEVFGIVCDHLKEAPFDLVFADGLSAASLDLMRMDACSARYTGGPVDGLPGRPPDRTAAA